MNLIAHLIVITQLLGFGIGENAHPNKITIYSLPFETLYYSDITPASIKSQSNAKFFEMKKNKEFETSLLNYLKEIQPQAKILL